MARSQPIYYAGQTIRSQIADQFRMFINIGIVVIVLMLLAFAFGASRGADFGGSPKNDPACSRNAETTGGRCYG